MVADGMTYGVCVSSLSRNLYPEMSTGAEPGLKSSTQSPGTPPFDSTSFSLIAQSLPVPFVSPEVVVTNAPEPSGQRPYVVEACVTQVYVSRRVLLGSKRRAESAPPSPKPSCNSLTTKNPPAARIVPAGMTYGA